MVHAAIEPAPSSGQNNNGANRLDHSDMLYRPTGPDTSSPGAGPRTEVAGKRTCRAQQSATFEMCALPIIEGISHSRRQKIEKTSCIMRNFLLCFAQIDRYVTLSTITGSIADASISNTRASLHTTTYEGYAGLLDRRRSIRSVRCTAPPDTKL